MALVKLTEKQKNILKLIKKYIEKNGYSPTLRELCDLTKLKSTSSIYSHLNKLQEAGYIKKERGEARTLRVIK